MQYWLILSSNDSTTADIVVDIIFHYIMIIVKVSSIYLDYYWDSYFNLKVTIFLDELFNKERKNSHVAHFKHGFNINFA